MIRNYLHPDFFNFLSRLITRSDVDVINKSGIKACINDFIDAINKINDISIANFRWVV